MVEKSDKKLEQKSDNSSTALRTSKMQAIVSWAKRRGFVYPSSEIYGGIGGVYDFGPYGVELYRNIKNLWWKTFVEKRDDVIGIDSSVLMNRKVWQASGHEKGFTDPLVECKKCHSRFRLDEIENLKSQETNSKQISNSKSQTKCLKCEGDLTDEKSFNTMFKTYVGPVDDNEDMTYLRPETAQGMFVNFKNVVDSTRKKLPFGIAQIGKCFRNEITTGEYLFRVREFEIAEIEYFVMPPRPGSGQAGEDEIWFEKWLKEWKDFVSAIGIDLKNIEEHEHPKAELSHYSKRTVDLQYKFPFGTKELTGLANRTDFDLKSHQEASGKDLQYFDEQSGKKYLPYVIEPTMGMGRMFLAIICDNYEEVKGGRSESETGVEKEVVMHFDPKIAPVKAAVLPLSKKLSPDAKKIYQDLKQEFGAIEYDEGGSIGRRYRRQDEIGTPYCLTFDFDSLKDKKVTIRDRDTMKQARVAIGDLKEYIRKKIK